MVSNAPASNRRWTSLWAVAGLSLLGQLGLCQFFSFGQRVPLSLDIDPSNLWKFTYPFPPHGEFLVLNWLGLANLPPPLNPFSLAAHLPPWLFFTAYAPVMATGALLAMAAFLRELELPRPAALFGGVVYAWQGDLLPFVFPGHFGYIATWTFFALAGWGALRGQRTGDWAYALIAGASCGLMVGLQPDRGAMASLLVAALYLAPAWKHRSTWLRQTRHLFLCAGVALAVSLAAFFALFQSFIVGVNMGGTTTREETYKFDTQFSLGPEETLTYLVPGFFGWYTNNLSGPYWGRIGERADWNEQAPGSRSLNLAISTLGTIPTTLTLLGALFLLVPGWFRPFAMTSRQLFFGRVLGVLSVVGLLLSWGYHTPLYRLVFALPLMDKWRNPLKWLELANFGWVVLSAYGTGLLVGLLSRSDAVDDSGLARRRVRLFLNGLAVSLFLALGASYFFAPSLTTYLEADGSDPATLTALTGTLHEALFFALVLTVLLGALIRLAWNPEFSRALSLENPWLNRAWKAVLQPERLPLTLVLSLAVLSTLQLGWVASQFIWPVRLAALTESNPLVDRLKSEGATVRVSVAAQDPMLNKLLQNQFLTPEISCLEISAASRLPDGLSAFLGNFDDDPARLWFLAGVKNRVVPQAAFAELERDPAVKANTDQVEGYTLEATGSPNLPSHALVQFRDYLAKATFVPGAEHFQSDQEELARLRDPKWNPRATVLLSVPAGAAPPDGRQATTAHVDLSVYHSQEIELRAETPVAGFILINDAYDPDWQVQVNGQDAPLLRADYLLRAVAVPAGKSTVSLRYVAHYRVAGFNLSTEATNAFSDLTMLSAWIVAGVALMKRGRRSAPPV